MILRVVNQTIIGEYDPLCTTALGTQCVDIAFCVFVVCGQETFVVAEAVTADALARVANDVAFFATKEGLTAHAKSAIIRTETKD